MIDFKEKIANIIAKEINLESDKIKENVEVPKDKTMGDFAFPCFILAKKFKKPPMVIADELKSKIELNEESKDYIEEVQAVSGFLNFKINKVKMTEELIKRFDEEKENYGSSKIGKDKTILVEYSSPNIAKPFHIGHLKNTILGHCLYNVYKFLGYNTIGLNHLGDYGTQFAKLIEAYKRWGNEYDFSENPIDKMAEMYVRINVLCESDENVLNECRDTFKKLEDGDAYCVDIWNKFKELSLKEFNKIYDILGVKFDSMNGEAFYSDKMQEVIDLLNEKGKLTESQGAMVVDLSDKGIETPCIIQKANGSSIYATRDLAAILYRARTYDFDKCLYVVAIEQSLHFKQIFEVAKYLNLDEKYINGLEHVSYGMIRLPEGKMSSRKGNFVKVNDVLNESISKVKEIMQDRDIENKDDVAQKIGIGAVVFNNLCETRIKDQVFDLNQALNFNGETGPYIQYICVRTKSVLEKAGYIPEVQDVDILNLQNKDAINVLNLLYSFNDIIQMVAQKNEPSILTRYLIDLSQEFSGFYNNNHILCDDKKIQDARLYLTYMVKTVLETGLNLLGIQVPDKM
jgi:arginyl-tRNA synthetase